MLSPGFVGVPVSPGQHSVLLSYQPGYWKLILACAGLLLACVMIAVERRGYLARLGFPLPEAGTAVETPPAAGATKRRRR